MGGIRNKLNKLANKAKILLSKALPLDRSSVSGTASRSTSGQPEVRRQEGVGTNLSDEVTRAKGFYLKR